MAAKAVFEGLHDFRGDTAPSLSLLLELMLCLHQFGLYPCPEHLVVLDFIAIEELRESRLDLLVDLVKTSFTSHVRSVAGCSSRM